MEAATVLRQARSGAGLTLRALATLAGTSHSTLAAYESGSKVPNTGTLNRIVEVAGYRLDTRLARRVSSSGSMSRGDELVAVLNLAAEFPARHEPKLGAPVFGR